MNMKYEILNIEISRKHSITMKRSTDVLVYFTLKYTERTLTVHYGVWGIQYYGEILLILYSTLHLCFFPSLCLSISPSALSLPRYLMMCYSGIYCSIPGFLFSVTQI